MASMKNNVMNGNDLEPMDANGSQSPNLILGLRDSNNNGNRSTASPNSVGNAQANGERLSRTNLYIRGLPASTTDQDLLAMCKHFGKITSTKSITDADGKCRGYGFVDFEQPEDAENALRELQKLNHQVQFARQQEQDPTNLYVQNLPPNFAESDLERMFSRYGAVVSTRILRSQNGASKGVGFSRMESTEKCELVIQAYNGLQLPGADEPLVVKFADGGQRKRIKQQQAAAAHAAAASAAAQLSAAQLVQQQQQLAALSAAALNPTISPALVGDLSAAYLRAQNLNLATTIGLNGYSAALLAAAANNPLAQLSRVGLSSIATLPTTQTIFASASSQGANGRTNTTTHAVPLANALSVQTNANWQNAAAQQQSAASHAHGHSHGHVHARAPSVGNGVHGQGDHRDGSNANAMLQMQTVSVPGASGHQQYYVQAGQPATLVPLHDNGLTIAVHNGQQYLTAAQPSVPVANAFCGTVASAIGAPNAMLHSLPMNAATTTAYYNGDY